MPPSPSAGAPAGRILQLDAIRGLAALAVVLFHYTTRYSQLFGRPTGLMGEFRHGDYGVQLFFMLSGFVILMTLARTNTVADFAVGRFSRLYPAYWAAVVVTFVVVSLANLPGKQVTALEALLNLTMVQQLLGAPHVDGAYWSLEVELLFYVAMAVLYRVGAFRRPWVTLLGWVTIGLAVHLALAGFGEEQPLLASGLRKLQTLLCLKYIHLFAIGMAFYQVYTSGRFTAPAGVTIACCVAVQAATDSWPGAALVTSFAAAYYWIVTGRLTVLTARPLLWLGSISYPLYLLHQNIGYVVIQRLNDLGLNANLSVAAACLLSIGLAAGVSRLVERPAMAHVKALYKTARGGLAPGLVRQLN